MQQSNYSDTITCVIPTHPSWSNPHVGDQQTAAGPFRFFAMPTDVATPETGRGAGRWDDAQDARFDYQRATPEKALLDWVYLGTSPRSRLTRPPFNTDVDSLDKRKLVRLVKRMGIQDQWDAWHRGYLAYQSDAEVQANASLWLWA